MRVAVTIFGSSVSPLCDAARRLAIFEIAGGAVSRLGEEDVGQLDLPGKLLLLRARGVRILVCGAISRFFHHALAEHNVQVYPWVTGEVEEVVQVLAAHLARESVGEKSPGRVAVTASGPDLEATVAPSFGRCSHYLVLEAGETGDTIVEIIEDDPAQPGRGCVAVASRLVAAGARTVLTGRCGPNALGVLAAAGVEVVLGVEGPVGEAVRRHRRGLAPGHGQERARRGRMTGRRRRRRGGEKTHEKGATQCQDSIERDRGGRGR